MNKGFELAEKYHKKNYETPKTLAYIATYNKNHPKLFTEMIKNLEETLDTTKVIKSQTTQKSLKNTHLFYIWENTTKCKMMWSMWYNYAKWCEVCDIIMQNDVEYMI